MSRAFLKNESADDPVVIPARAPLPVGATNYVTPRGIALLLAERDDLEREHAQVQTSERDETERTRELALLNGRIGAINQRIATAKVVAKHNQAQDSLIRFGATVTFHTYQVKNAQIERKLTIVGVDEADATNGRIAFSAPVARLLLGKQVGERIVLKTPQGDKTMEIIAISYDD